MNEWVAGGYRLTRPVPRPAFFADGLLPDALLSFGGCIAEPPGFLRWAGGEPEKLGIPEDRIADVDGWAQGAFETVFGYTDIFYTLDAARDFVARFIPGPPDDLAILCGALTPAHADAVIAEHTQITGIVTSLMRNTSPVEGGKVLGYEPLCVYWDQINHTWLCNHLHQDALRRWGYRPNALGFLDTYEEAKTVADAAFPGGAEDGLWLPWHILRYDAETS